MPGAALLERLYGRWRAWLDTAVDRRYGVDTDGYVHLETLGATEARRLGANNYEPITPTVFRAMLKAAAIRPSEYVFVDYGCGKGRALILAAEHGFRRVIGVELVPALHAIALDNAREFEHRRRPGAARIEALCGDATRYLPPPEDALLYLYNPFGEALVRRTLATIECAWRRRPTGRLLIAYRNPVHANVFDEAPFLRAIARNSTFAVYRAVQVISATP